MKEIEKFGEFFVRNTRDQALHNLNTLLSGAAKAPDQQSLQRSLAEFSEEQKQTIRELVDDLTTGMMHDLLYAFQEASDSEEGIIVQVDGKDIAQESDGLHGELFTEDGWIKRFSEYEYDENKD
ncbi:DUF6547 family protein [Pelagicoccus sp. SDUM812003]|uniref:DUF6547 family protein n=1 Tax=Pelagicoccus sp. SDUM812003 TaxID=3041267 RepID=UPI00280ED07C|nr:DUF6547 family protein [Pelagicoccus sp. SDUM812003]MDQ8205786.1 hypothetical protein [Pelagicoccus sp. SDUM812003]